MARPGGVIGLAVGLWLGLAGVSAAQTVNVIPEPLSAERLTGAGLRIADGVPIVAPRGDAGALAAARYLSALLQRTRGLTLPVQADAPATGPAIRIARAAAPAGEGYALAVAGGHADITAADDAGLFYGAVTLWQLITADGARGPAEIAAVRIADAPRFAWRGLMIDSARHFQSPAEIERIIDAMAAHKLNVLHWHLTDDQGWRLQIKKYPRLTGVGAWRRPPAGSPDGTARYGGVYSQAEVRRIVAYAAARHVTIVPEIEMPGHAVSALLAYPQFGAGAKPPAAAQTQWGGFPYVYSPSDRTFGFLEDVLTEVMALFPGRFVHVGGDEVARERWNASPEAQARLRALGVTDPAALQADFTKRIAGFLEAHGRRLVGWDEILGGELPGDAVVTSWHGVDGALAAAAKGHDAVLAPAPVMYFDNWQAQAADAPPGRGFLVRLQDVYAFEPAPATLAPAVAAHILGLQGNVWTEHVRTEAQLEAMAFPRILAVAETGWSAPNRKDWTGFLNRLPADVGRLDALGIRADRSALAAPRPLPAASRASQELRLCNDKLALNLEGAGPAHRTYLINPQDPCWIWAGADLEGVRRVTVDFARLPFNFGLDAAHNTVLLHPPRTPSGEIEVRQDSCTADPIAVAALPPGGPGGRGAVTLKLPPRSGRHDLCFTFTGRSFDPTPALGQVRLETAP
ncbi:MAG: Beta-N-acetylhexosaminidase [Phenylobacterium sp.]|nr:Beta-N-acetylhexosaminidase [Phenylobacterium sp.]